MKRYSIYILTNPLTLEIFYVGKTEQNLETRRNCHLYGYSNPKNPRGLKTEIIIEIITAGKVPIVEEIDYVYGLKEALEREKFWIYELHKNGSPLTNREVCPSPGYDVFFTTNFPYGVSVSKKKEIPIQLLMYGKHGNRLYPEYVVSKDHPKYKEVHEKDYHRGLCSSLITIREEIFPFLKKPMTDKEILGDSYEEKIKLLQ